MSVGRLLRRGGRGGGGDLDCGWMDVDLLVGVNGVFGIMYCMKVDDG